ncbi:MAG: DUF6027 family protein [Acidimicrobiales bacterium]
MSGDAQSINLTAWRGPWASDDPDANFKTDIALYANVDPMTTISRLASAINVPEGAIVRYVLAKWASGGSGGLLELGPTMVHRLWEPVEGAERAGTDGARLAAYEQLRQMITWLRIPLVEEGESSGY